MNTDLLILGVIALLLLLSALPATSTFAMYAGGLLFLLVWMNAGLTKTQSGQTALQSLGQELLTSPGVIQQ